MYRPKRDMEGRPEHAPETVQRPPGGGGSRGGMPFFMKLLLFLLLSLALGFVGGGAFSMWKLMRSEERVAGREEQRQKEAEKQKGGRFTGEAKPAAAEVMALCRPTLFDGITLLHSENRPAVPEVSLNPDFSNVINANHSGLQMSEGQRELLGQNYFLVAPSSYDEFFEVYEWNRYRYIPNFVTVDSMMHTYHLYFMRLMKNTEREYLAPELTRLSADMLERSGAQLETLRGTEWEAAAKLNTLFFGVASELMEAGGDIPAELREQVEEQLNHVREADGIYPSLTGDPEDFSQYMPRGYYAGDVQLEKYFRAMMWYGRLNFAQSKEVLDRAALLMTLALRENGLSGWESLYTVTSFFAGSSDDNGYYEYEPLIEAAYGEQAELTQLIGNEQGWSKFHELTKMAEPPKINSVFTDERNTGEAQENVHTLINRTLHDRNTGEARENEIRGFRFMGQRFSADEVILQKLMYNEVQEINGEKRDLPSGLDVPAAFGSDAALNILRAAGEDRFPGYTEHMERLRRDLAAAGDDFWNASLYSRWLYTLRPLLENKNGGYPLFMQSEEWNGKNLQSFLGSYTELKHDTVLYAKQVMVEMGSDDPPLLDDRGYVEPEPELWGRLYTLSEATESGLERYGILGESDKNNLNLLKQLIGQLRTISEKELADTPRTDAEYELIRTYGGQIEHFWREVYQEEAEAAGTGLYTRNFPSALITDVATGYGRVLELGTGECACIYVLVPIDGSLRIAVGSVYSYYEFPYDRRLTDEEWRIMMGLQQDASGVYRNSGQLSQPEWTQSFTRDWNW